MNLIFFTHQESISEFFFKEFRKFDDFDKLVCVTNMKDFLSAARELQDFAVIVGQLRTRGFIECEKALALEGIVAKRRVLFAPIITDEFLQWAGANNFDAVLNPVDDIYAIGPRVHEAMFPKPGQQPFPATLASGKIPYQDLLDQSLVRLISVGLTNDEIAQRLNFSVQTIRNRVSRILAASGARNRTHLAAMYLIPFTANFQAESSDDISIEREVKIETSRHDSPPP